MKCFERGVASIAIVALLAGCGGSHTVMPPINSTTDAVRADAVTAATTTYKVVDLSVGYPKSQANAAITGYQGGDFVAQTVRYPCGPIPPIQYCYGALKHAVLWRGTSSSGQILDTGSSSTVVLGITDGIQVGSRGGDPFNGVAMQAVLWRGTASSMTSLAPANAVNSVAHAVDGTIQAGAALTSNSSTGLSHAFIWRGTAASAVDLNPAGALGSEALAVRSGIEGGDISVPAGPGLNVLHAAVWSGTAASAHDLNPAGYSGGSIIFGIDSSTNTEAGTAAINGSAHAFLWRGQTSSGVDLHPSAFSDSAAYAAANGKQVGIVANSSDTPHAVVWSGTAASYIDLQKFLPSTFTSSEAKAIAPDGTISGFATDANGQHAILWIPLSASGIGIVQKASGGTHSTSTSCTFASAPAAGNVIIFGVGYYPLTTTITPPAGVTAINATNQGEQDYYRVVRTGDSRTWTFTGNGYPYINVICYEVRGENASSPIDAHGENRTSTQVQTTVSVTPVTSGDLPIAFFGNGNRTAFTGLTPGWTDDINETRGYYSQFGTHGPIASLSPVHASITLTGGAASGGTALVLVKP